MQITRFRLSRESVNPHSPFLSQCVNCVAILTSAHTLVTSAPRNSGSHTSGCSIHILDFGDPPSAVATTIFSWLGAPPLYPSHLTSPLLLPSPSCPQDCSLSVGLLLLLFISSQHESCCLKPGLTLPPLHTQGTASSPESLQRSFALDNERCCSSATTSPCRRRCLCGNPTGWLSLITCFSFRHLTGSITSSALFYRE